jgi:hypothetical protein
MRLGLFNATAFILRQACRDVLNPGFVALAACIAKRLA